MADHACGTARATGLAGGAGSAAALPTTQVLAAGADEVSAAVAALFSGHAQAYQAVSSQAAAFHAHFVQMLQAGAGAYATAEAANASPMQQLLNAINAPTQTLLGRPLIGDGANGVDGTGAARGAGGGGGGCAVGQLPCPPGAALRAG
ncbi:PE family protein, partial [Mycobacterium intermedium]|uniref:PE family protein n=1 Tax=Mycobacterium intermedium TaxID=28445 RepID=UPI00111BE9FE